MADTFEMRSNATICIFRHYPQYKIPPNTLINRAFVGSCPYSSKNVARCQRVAPPEIRRRRKIENGAGRPLDIFGCKIGHAHGRNGAHGRERARTNLPRVFARAGHDAIAHRLAPLAGSFSKAAALAAYTRARSSYSAIIGQIEPMVIGGPGRSRGFAPYYQVR